MPEDRTALRLPAHNSAFRLEVSPRERREEDVFLNAFSFKGNEPPALSFKRNGRRVALAIRDGKREFSVRLVTGAPGEGRINIKQDGKMLFDGPLVSGSGRRAETEPRLRRKE